MCISNGLSINIQQATSFHVRITAPGHILAVAKVNYEEEEEKAG